MNERFKLKRAVENAIFSEVHFITEREKRKRERERRKRRRKGDMLMFSFLPFDFLAAVIAVFFTRKIISREKTIRRE